MVLTPSEVGSGLESVEEVRESMSSSNRTSHQRARAAAALAVGGTQEQAALVAGVTARTVRRWLDDGLESEVRAAQAAQSVRTSARLMGMAHTAAEVLDQIMHDSEVPPSVRIRAASVILQCSRDWRQSEQTEQRLLAIEEALRARHEAE